MYDQYVYDWNDTVLNIQLLLLQSQWWFYFSTCKKEKTSIKSTRGAANIDYSLFLRYVFDLATCIFLHFRDHISSHVHSFIFRLNDFNDSRQKTVIYSILIKMFHDGWRGSVAHTSTITYRNERFICNQIWLINKCCVASENYQQEKKIKYHNKVDRLLHARSTTTTKREEQETSVRKRIMHSKLQHFNMNLIVLTIYLFK